MKIVKKLGIGLIPADLKIKKLATVTPVTSN